MNGEAIELPTASEIPAQSVQNVEGKGDQDIRPQESHGEEPSIAYTPLETHTCHGEEPSIPYTPAETHTSHGEESSIAYTPLRKGTESTLPPIEKSGASNCVISGTAVEALFPSLSDLESARIAGEEVMISSVGLRILIMMQH